MLAVTDSIRGCLYGARGHPSLQARPSFLSVSVKHVEKNGPGAGKRTVVQPCESDTALQTRGHRPLLRKADITSQCCGSFHLRSEPP